MRNAFGGGRAESYEEVAVVEAFRATAAAHIGSCAVESSEADVGGLSPCYTQKYQNARIAEGDPFGEGSFRCLVTTATAGGTGRPADGGDAEMQLG